MKMKKFVVTMLDGHKETVATARPYEEGYICESPYKFTSFVTNLNDYYKNDFGKWVEA